jgi:hypothetical protein
MPLPLTDPRWAELRGSYGSTDDIVAWLTEAHVSGLTDERLGDLINEVQHQGDTSTAMYAVAGHLISLARQASPAEALRLLTHAGLIHASSDRPKAVPCPTFLQEEFTSSAQEGAQMLSPLLPQAGDFAAFKWGVAALAGFVGHRNFARFLDGLDFYEGKYYHALLDAPFPPEV